MDRGRLRRTGTASIAASVCAFFLLAGVADADVTQLGTRLDTSSGEPSIAGVGGAPWVAWSGNAAGAGTGGVLVKQWTGSAWTLVGGPLSAAGSSPDKPSITTVGGVAYVAWHELDSGSVEHIFVSKWNGSAWVAVGGSLLDPGKTIVGTDVDIADVGGVPYVTWSQQTGGAGTAEVRVKKFVSGSPGSWQAVGGVVNSDPTRDAVEPSIAGISGQPYVAFRQTEATGFTTRVSTFAPSSWSAVGGGPVGTSPGDSTPLIDAIGTAPIVLWYEQGSGVQPLRVSKLNAGAWSAIGPAISANAPSNHLPALTVDGSVPYVAWISSFDSPAISTASYDGASWVAGGSPSIQPFGSIGIQYPALAAVAGTTYLAWSDWDGSANGRLFVGKVENPIPDTIITSGPTVANGPTATFEFTADPENGASFECWVDGAAPAPCTSPYTTPVLPEGTHTFHVQATNSAGPDPTPATRDVNMDFHAPTVGLQLSGTKTSGGAYAGSVHIDLSASDPPPGAGIRGEYCIVDPPAPPTFLSSFGSHPCGFDYTTPGTHTVYGIANDEASNESQIVNETFTVLATPETTITGGPGDPHAAPTFTFTASPAGSTFECQTDGAAYIPCSSPYTAFGLTFGPHSFSVRAISPAGVADPTPAQSAFTLEQKKVSGNCTVQIDWDHPESSRGCLVLDETCPLGSVCQVAAKIDGATKDSGATYGIQDDTFFGGRPSAGGAGVGPLGANVQAACSMGFEKRTDSCSKTASVSSHGTDQRVFSYCEMLGAAFQGKTDKARRGPDKARTATCHATMTITPPTVLVPISGGTDISIFVPGSGKLAIGSAGAAKARIPTLERKGKPLFKPIELNPTEAGPVDLPLKLSATAKRKLKQKGKLALPLSISFTPTGSAQAETSTTKVTLAPACKASLKAPKKPC